jgi:hypothetical protein
LREFLLDAWSELIRRRDEILGGIDRATAQYETIPNEDVLAKMTDFVSSQGVIGRFLAAADHQHDEEKAPFLASGRVIDGMWHEIIDKVKAGREVLLSRMTAFARAEDERKRKLAFEAAQKAAEEAKALERKAERSGDEEDFEAAAAKYHQAETAIDLANARPAERTRTRGELGTVGSLRGTWKFFPEESELAALVKAAAAPGGASLLRYLAFNDKAIGFGVRSEKLRELPGCVIREERKYG